MGLLGPNGHPMETYKKAPAPKTGPAFGAWSGRDVQYGILPGGGTMTFDTSKLTLADFRAMRDHPQINLSLTVLTFMMHGLDWHIQSEDQKVATAVEGWLQEVWTRLIRACSQSYWSGFSPIAIEYDNDVHGKNVVISKFKDLIPEECRVNWKKVQGYAPPNQAKPNFYIYDGIVQWHMGRMNQSSNPIPVENSLWYPLLMENGDYYGRKLLKPAFSAWYFSILMHLFSNRYFERFGEPTPIGRAPFDAQIEQQDGTFMSGKTAMENILTNLRNRGVVVLPNDRDPVTKEFDYEMEYLESQMRGADFERYMSRLDEEMSIAIFTPVSLLRIPEKGSFNMSVGHMQMYMWMLNALAHDLKEYIDKYVVKRLKDYNFGPNAAEAYWVPRKMGKENVQAVEAISQAMVTAGTIKPDIEQLGDILGLTFEEQQVLQAPSDQVPASAMTDANGEPIPQNAKTTPGQDPRTRIRPTGTRGNPRGVGQPRATSRNVASRINAQVDKAWRDKSFGPQFNPSFGYEKQFELALVAEGWEPNEAQEATLEFYSRVGSWTRQAADLGPESYAGPSEFMSMFGQLLDSEIERLGGIE